MINHLADEWDLISQDARNLVTKMLTYDFNSRISAKVALSDPWI